MRNKFLKGVVTFSVASAICMAMGITASAASIKDGDITIDTETQTLTVKEEVPETTPETPAPEAEGDEEDPDTDPSPSVAAVDREVLFSVSTVKSGKITASAWDVYTMTTETEDIKGDDGVTTGTKTYKTTTIDLSSLNTQKDNYIQIKGDRNEDVVTIKIPLTDKKVKPKYDAATGTVSAEGNTLPLEYRTQYGAWQDYVAPGEGVTNATDLSLYQQRGATLYFRLKAIAAPTSNNTETLNDATKNSDKTFTATIKESLPGKEIKVKIGKLANAPKATISYTKNTVTLPKDVKSRVFADSVDDLSGVDWSAVTSAKTTVEDKEGAPSLTTLLEGGALEIKTAKSGKAESKVGHYDFPVQGVIYGMATEGEDDAVAAGSVTDAIISEVEGSTDTTKSVIAAVSEVKNKKGDVTSHNLTITNNTADKYEVVYNSDSAPTATTKGIKSIKAGKSVTIKKVEKDKKVWIRRSGDQKAEKWATAWEVMGKVDWTETSTGGEEDTVTPLLNKIKEKYFVDSVTLNSSASVGDEITITKESGVTIGGSGDYTVDTDTEVKGVTVTIAVNDVAMDDSGTDQGDAIEVAADGSKVQYKLRGAFISIYSFTGTPKINVTLKKDGKEVTFPISVSK